MTAAWLLYCTGYSKLIRRNDHQPNMYVEIYVESATVTHN